MTSNVANSPVGASSEIVKTAYNDRRTPIASLYQDTCQTNNFRNILSNPKIPSTFSPELPLGSNNPQLVSDTVAYTMVLRLLSSHENNPRQIKRLRAYIRQNLGITEQSDILAVFRLASDFKQRINTFDNQVTTIKDRYHALGHPAYSQDDQQRLNRLKLDKERVVDNLIQDIPRRMSANGKDRLNQSIQGRVKSKIKIQP